MVKSRKMETPEEREARIAKQQEKAAKLPRLVGGFGNREDRRRVQSNKQRGPAFHSRFKPVGDEQRIIRNAPFVPGRYGKAHQKQANRGSK